MVSYINSLKEFLQKNLPNYGEGDAHSILGMLYVHYCEFNHFENDKVSQGFEELYHVLGAMELRNIDRIIDIVCSLCSDHEESGFIEGVKVGILLSEELH